MLTELQKEHAVWQKRNFPNAEKWETLVGIQEEIGELSHSFLKRHQGIRGSSDEHLMSIKDAVGDIIIFVMGFCTLNDINIDECIETAWNEVKERDWTINGELQK